MKLPKSFYTRTDVIEISRDLLGKVLCTYIDGLFTSGIIVETEAYCGDRDKASHAHLKRRTKRTEVMFHEGGKAYVYLVYGIHHLFNIVTNVEGTADAVLVRAIQPQEGADIMLQRRKLKKMAYKLSAGPGILSQAMGINKKHYGVSLLEDLIWIEDRHNDVADDAIIASPRVGIDYAEEDALLPWRFRIRDNPWTSPAK